MGGHGACSPLLAALALVSTTAQPTRRCSSWHKHDVCPAARNLLSKAALQRLACESEEWREQVDEMLGGKLPPPHPKRISQTATRKDGRMGMACGKCRFDVWMPSHAVCNQTTFGEGDGGKLLCGLESQPRGVVLSIGSRGDVSFERSVLERTTASLEIFDCTVSRCMVARSMRAWPPELHRGRMRFHPICLGARDELSKRGGAVREDWEAQEHAKSVTFMSYQSIAAHLGVGVSAVKMDIEGFEWGIFEGLLAAAAADSSVPLPSQIAFELHLYTQMATLNWTSPFKAWQDVARLSRALYDAGYRTLSAVFNARCGHCTEYTLLRVFCPRGAGAVAAPSVAVEQAPWGADPSDGKGCNEPKSCIRRRAPRSG